ncbi:hypothetical protein [Undibacterium aquatile]|uniref:Uncharacterized protein n=1 Tax=Undibacterium aquatile TaxID=1537398 RepID=A0ABR6XC52_9BURK|nr:hypothetical protein [Undibacterium aquatile]MBC3809864.1 hypothetical protein [Undibacterium aquatile]
MENITSPTSPTPRLFDQVRERLRYQRYLFATEKPSAWDTFLHTLATDKNRLKNGRRAA